MAIKDIVCYDNKRSYELWHTCI